MRGIAPDKMSVEQLREAVSVMSRRGGGGVQPPRLSVWSRARCIEWLKNADGFVWFKKENTISKREVKVSECNVGEFCQNLLKVVVGKTDDGFTVGLSYQKIMELAQRHYPCSKVDEKHLRWYSTFMRSAGDMFPVHREKSRWKKK